MPVQITLTVSKGHANQKTFLYDQKESLILGRQNDCSIKFTENTVSRYHCLMDIAPPSVMVRDFGSLNGTFLNGKEIGRRPKDMSPEEARKKRSNEFSLKSGDRLGLGSDCEIIVHIALPQYCAFCLCELSNVSYKNAAGLPLCQNCYAKAKEQPAENALNKRQCQLCGATVNGEGDICSACLDNPLKALEHLLRRVNDDAGGNGEIAGYRKIKSLGKGGMGEVWLVEEEKSRQQMALKVMLPKAAANENSRELFLREAYISGQLIHNNVVRQFKNGRSGNIYYIIMELCEGGSLDELIKKKGGKLGLDLATHIMLQVLDGLEYAHNAQIEVKLPNQQTQTVRGVVHRDFKPGNIFLTGNLNKPVAKVADFGLAKAFEIAGLSGHTHTGQFAGTPVFMPRQQIIDYRYAKPAVDVWAAAASYYFMLTGTYPKKFDGGDIFGAALSESAVPIRERNAAVPRRLADVIDRALIEKPDIGVQSARELKEMIQGAL